MKFADKVVMVTGAGGNLGRAVVDAFVAAGASVAAVEHGDGGAKTPPDAFDRRLTLHADLLDELSTRAAADAVFERWGRIDVLCNIAGGFAAGTPVHETPDDLWRRMFDLNLMTTIHASKAVVPRMIAAGRGNIVNVAAASSQRGQASMAAYGVAKSGVIRLTESMAAELRSRGICVTCILPTTIDTPQNRAAMADADISQWTPPEAIAEVVLFLTSDAAMITSGCAIPLAGRAHRKQQ
jgi:NAD(P)-dependent dehydrogenase (short-subunit alcohol dehydrogenase family)